MKTYFDILGVAIKADEKTVKRAYKLCCELFQNDSERLLEVKAAYKVLGNLLERKRYEADLTKRGELHDGAPVELPKEPAVSPESAPVASVRNQSKPATKAGTDIGAGKSDAEKTNERTAQGRTGTDIDINNRGNVKPPKQSPEKRGASSDTNAKTGSDKPLDRKGTELGSEQKPPVVAEALPPAAKSSAKAAAQTPIKQTKRETKRDNTTFTIPNISQGKSDSTRKPPDPSTDKKDPTDIYVEHPPQDPPNDLTKVKPTSPEPRMPALHIVGKDMRFRLHAGDNYIGRTGASDPPLDIPLNDDTKFISRTHARIFNDGDQWYISDTSTNGTLVNGEELTKGKRLLSPGDRIQIEHYMFIFER